MLTASYEVLVIGGGTGGVAAALAASRAGRRTLLVEESDWLGGQLTSQGVSAPDENQYIERRCAATRSYYELREAIRDLYRARYHARPGCEPLNPGAGWVSHLCFEPAVGVQAIEQLLRPHLDSGILEVRYGRVPTSVKREGERLRHVRLQVRDAANGATRATRATGVADVRGAGGVTNELREEWVEAAYVLDATELGDLLPLAELPYRLGADGRNETGEPSAPAEPHPEWVQSITFPFAVAFLPGERHTIPKPAGYEAMRENQPFSLEVDYGKGKRLTYRMFEQAPGTPGSFWSYRRIFGRDPFTEDDVATEISMINWPGNDARVGDQLIDRSAPVREAALERARQLSLAFLYWLQTEAPRDDGGYGYPELKVLPEAMGGKYGLSRQPYIRESRRLVGLTTVREVDIGEQFVETARARPFFDTVGIGWYPMDIHAGHPDEQGAGGRTRPFQIPLGALLSPSASNFIAAGKALSATHLATSAYRLHPIEWAIGESAGMLAAFCLDEAVQPTRVAQDEALLRRFQRSLAEAGVPLCWFDDVPVDHPAFPHIQVLAAEGILPADPDHIHFHPADRAQGLSAALRTDPSSGPSSDPLPSDLIRQARDREGDLSRGAFAWWLDQARTEADGQRSV